MNLIDSIPVIIEGSIALKFMDMAFDDKNKKMSLLNKVGVK